jgi:spore maturation protein CgeB
MGDRLRIAIFGLSVTSSWGNGHATTFRGLIRGLLSLGHQVDFFERDQPWYADHRDPYDPTWGRVHLYRHLFELKESATSIIASADLIIIGSCVPEATSLASWIFSQSDSHAVTAFYDLDTPVTLRDLPRGVCPYLCARDVPRFDLYLSFAGGPTLDLIERKYGSPNARALYCSVDVEDYGWKAVPHRWDLGFMGTYSADRRPYLEEFLFLPAILSPKYRMVVAGPQYSSVIAWPTNVDRLSYLSPVDHPRFYSSQRFALSLSRELMRTVGYSPSVRLFEAAACCTPVITDSWPGLSDFFVPGEEILITRSANDILAYLNDVSEQQRVLIGTRAQERVLRHHTSFHRAMQLESYFHEVRGERTSVSTYAPISRTERRLT